MGDRRNGWVVVSVMVVAVVALAASGCAGGSDASQRTKPSTTGPDISVTTETTPVESSEGIAPDPELFTRQRAILHEADGDTCDVCVWVADTRLEYRTGLAGVTTVGDADGMAFVYDPPTENGFWMKGTLFDLDIVFFDRDGVRVGSERMIPCEGSQCRTYSPGMPYSTAFEYRPERLDELGVSDIERFELTAESCDFNPGDVA